MSDGDKRNSERNSFEPSPAWCAHELPKALLARANKILQFKGLLEGVPLNTERAAVKPRVGIAR